MENEENMADGKKVNFTRNAEEKEGMKRRRNE